MAMPFLPSLYFGNEIVRTRKKSPFARILVKLILSDGFAALFRQTAVVIQFVRQWTFNPLLLSGYYMHSSSPVTLYTSSFNFDNGSCRKKYDASILRDYMSDFTKHVRTCQKKRPGCLISRRNKKFQNPPKLFGFVYSPLWKITGFGGRLFRSGGLFQQIRYVMKFDGNEILDGLRSITNSFLFRGGVVSWFYCSIVLSVYPSTVACYEYLTMKTWLKERVAG